MNRMPSRWLWSAAAALFVTACAQSVGDVNRVQPNVLKKQEILDGQWYLRNTVTWTPATSGFTYTGETGNLEKLVFEVQKDLLVGYRSYPYIPGSVEGVEPSSVPSGTTATYCGTNEAGAYECVGGQKFYGAPVVAYDIVKHFDVRREYNPRTGETTNVISENDTDRPWNEREFIRVDWSTNKLNMGESVGWNTVQNPAGATVINSWIQEDEPGTDPYDWPRVEYGLTDKPGVTRLQYLDFTARYYVKPDSVYFDEEYGSIPLCYLTTGVRYDCTAQQIRVRTSMARVDTNKTLDYEPLVYPNDLMSKFGYFRTERLTYDRKFGVTESGRVFLANRYNIWKNTFQRDDKGNVDQTRPIPFAAREVKPIIYYVASAERMGGADVYKEYLEAARVLERNWDLAFRRAVSAAQNKNLNDTPRVLYVCENPVPERDTLTGEPISDDVRRACGHPGFSPRFGDLRYSFLWTITEPVPNGLLGYGPSSADPETGEIISANANTYTGAVDSQAQRALDIIDILDPDGGKSSFDLVSGDDVRRYILSNPSYASVFQHKSGPIKSELQDLPRSLEPSVGAFDRPTLATQGVIQSLRAAGGLPASNGDRLAAAAAKLADHPALEAVILDNPETQAAVLGLAPPHLAALATQDSTMFRNVARKVLLNPQQLDAFRQERVEWASRRSITLEEFMDRPMFGLALEEAKARRDRISHLVATEKKTPVEARKIADNELRRRLQQSIWRATSEHEIGHTFGLRHNFQASFDAINYHDRYWDLRKPTITVDQGGVPKIPRTPGDLKLASDGTEDQLKQKMHDYEYSSIMDYGGKINADFQGLGKYDEAAILFAYSGGREPGYVEVFASARPDVREFPGSDGKTVAVTGAAQDLAIVNAQRKHPAIPNYTERYHYSLVPLHFGEGASVGDTINDGINKLRSRRLMKWADVKSEHERVAKLLQVNASPTAADMGNVPLEVPYMFCTDDHVGAVLSCNRFDRGADYYEMTRTRLEDYWNYYFFTHFRRDRLEFSLNPAFNGAASTFTESANVYKHWVHAMFQRQSAAQQPLANYALDPLMQDTWTMGALDGIDNALRVISVPASGMYFRNQSYWQHFNYGFDWDDFSPAAIDSLKKLYPGIEMLIVPRGVGRRMESRYDFKSGFGFQYKMLEAGHWVDQYAALYAISDPSLTLLGVDDRADQNRYYVPYYLMFKKELNNILGSVWAENLPKFWPTVHKATDPATGQLSDYASTDYGVRVKGSDYIQGFDYPKAAPAQPTAANAAPAYFQNSYSGRIYSLWLGMAMFSVNYDYDYAKLNQVFRLGSGESITVGADYEVVELNLPNGQRYAAVQPKGTPVGSETPAVYMLKAAQRRVDELATVTDPQRRGYLELLISYDVRDLDTMRGMYSVFGKAF